MQDITAADGRLSITVDGNSVVKGVHVGDNGTLSVGFVGSKWAWRWHVTQRIAVYAAILAFCVLCWWGFFALMFRLFGG